MATEGPNQFGAVSEFDDGWTPITNVGNAVADDNSYATVSLNASEFTAYSNFFDWVTAGLSAPADAADVTHVLAEVACKSTGSFSRVFSVQLLVGGSPVGDVVNVAASIGASESYVSLGTIAVSGGSSFGTTLTGAQAKATGFGVRIQFDQLSGSETISVDAARVTITYTGGGGGGTTAPPHRRRVTRFFRRRF